MRARLWRYEISLASVVTASSQVHDARSHLFLELEVDGVLGFSEIAPQPHTLNGDPGIEDVLVEFEHFTLRQFFEAARREGRVPHWARVTHFAGSRPASYPACALLEMAVLDLELRARKATLDDQWPARYATPTQVTVSLLDDQPWVTTNQAAQVRAKVSSETISTDRWNRLSELGLPVLLDFNCSGETIDAVVGTVARAHDHVRVVAVEQPFAPGNVVEHARVAAALDVPVSLDEGVRHRRDLDQIVRYQAAQMVCVKPARVGGYAQARTMIERAQHLGLEVYLGGFFESPLARHANRVLAQHYLSRPSDIGDVLVVGTDPLTPDPWGCGFLPGEALTSSPALLTQLR